MSHRLQHQKPKRSNHQSGWATLELIMTLPIVMMMLYSILYVGQYTLARLQLMSLVDSLARQAAISGCTKAEASVGSHLPANLELKSKDCEGEAGEFITMKVETEFKSALPLALLPKTVTSESYVWNENQN